MEWQIDFIRNLLYSTLYSSLVIILLFVIRKLLGKWIKSYYLFHMWIYVITFFTVIMTIFKKGNYTYSYYGKYVTIPPFDITINIMGVLDEESIFRRTGDIILEIRNNFSLNRIIINGNIVLMMIFIIWLLGYIFLLSRYLIEYISWRIKLKKYETCDSTSISVLYNECLFWRCTHPKVKFVPEADFKSKGYFGVIGFGKPTLILVKEKWDHLSEDEKRFLIMHAIYRIKNGQNSKNLFFLILFGIHWFNPIIHLGRKLCMKDLDCLYVEQVLKKLSEDESTYYINTISKIMRMNHTKHRSHIFEGLIYSKDCKVLQNIIKKSKRKTYLWEIIVILIYIALLIYLLYTKETINLISKFYIGSY